MDNDEFREWSMKAAGWGADYRAGLRERPVRAQTAPGDIAARIPASPPEEGEAMDAVFADFENIIVPGMTHWQHPRFFAYFPANAAPVSVVAEYLVTAMAAQCMLWQTAPAATELETKMLDWLRQALGLPDAFSGDNDPAAIAELWASLEQQDLRPLLSEIRHPTLIVHGAQSQLYGADTADHLVAALPNARAVRFARSGHAPHLEEPVLFNRTVIDFAASLPPVTSTKTDFRNRRIG